MPSMRVTLNSNDQYQKNETLKIVADLRTIFKYSDNGDINNVSSLEASDRSKLVPTHKSSSAIWSETNEGNSQHKEQYNTTKTDTVIYSEPRSKLIQRQYTSRVRQ